MPNRCRDFAVDLAKCGMSVEDIIKMTRKVYEKGIGRTQAYAIKRQLKEGRDMANQIFRGGLVRFVRTNSNVNRVKAIIEADRRLSVTQIMAETKLTRTTIHNILTKDLGLVKRCARWIPKILNEEQKASRVRCCKAFLAAAAADPDFLDAVVTMDETSVAFSTPETKRQSMQWVKKGSPGPIKARRHTSRRHQMVVTFFDRAGLVYQHYMPAGQTMNSSYYIKTLKAFKKAYAKKRPQNRGKVVKLHSDNAPAHASKMTQEYMAANSSWINPVEHPPYSPDLAPCDFWLFPKAKSLLGGIHIEGKTVRHQWERVCRQLNSDDFVEAYEKWLRRCQKCVDLHGGYVEKEESK